MTPELQQEIRGIVAQAKHHGQGWHVDILPSGRHTITCARGDCPMGAIIRATVPIYAYNAEARRLAYCISNQYPTDSLSPKVALCVGVLNIQYRAASLVALASDGLNLTTDDEVTWTRKLLETELLNEPNAGITT